MSNGPMHLGMAHLHDTSQRHGVNSLTKTAYVDLTDMLNYLERLMPVLIHEAQADQHSHVNFMDNYRALDILDDLTAIYLKATSDTRDRDHRLQHFLGQNYPQITNMYLSKLGIVFGSFSPAQFEELAQCISYSFIDYGVIFTFPTVEWME